MAKKKIAKKKVRGKMVSRKQVRKQRRKFVPMQQTTKVVPATAQPKISPDTNTPFKREEVRRMDSPEAKKPAPVVQTQTKKSANPGLAGRLLAVLVLVLLIAIGPGLVGYAAGQFMAGFNSVNGQPSANAANVEPTKSTSNPNQPAAPSAPLVSMDLPDPTNVDGWKVFRQGLPAYIDFRDMVLSPGDDATGVVVFEQDYANIVVMRVVPDDVFNSILYYPADGSDPISLLALFDMQFVAAGGTGNADTDLVLCSRGVNIVEGEILQQNMTAVQLGAVQSGSYIVFQISDNPDLAVNNGSLVAVSADSDPMTVDLDGNPIGEPTFIPESCTPTD